MSSTSFVHSWIITVRYGPLMWAARVICCASLLAGPPSIRMRSCRPHRQATESKCVYSRQDEERMTRQKKKKNDENDKPGKKETASISALSTDGVRVYALNRYANAFAWGWVDSRHIFWSINMIMNLLSCRELYRQCSLDSIIWHVAEIDLE